jgi:hypothetical protein
MTIPRVRLGRILPFLAALACFPGFLVHASDLSGPTVEVLAASYSIGSDCADVTARVRYLLQSDALFRANPERLHVDPHPGLNKALVILCEVDGKRAIFSVGEGEGVSRELLRENARVLPDEKPAASPPPPGQAVNVLAASFSYGADYADVTARVRDLVLSGASFQVNPGSLGADPHPYGSKVLVVFCEVDGKRAIFSAGEGEGVSAGVLREKARVIPDEAPEPAMVAASAKAPRFLPIEGLWLGDPEVDPAEARARAVVYMANRQFFNVTTSLSEYNRVGSHNPKWDDDARRALRIYAPPPLAGEVEIEGDHAALAAALQRTLHDGCDDPLIVYLALLEHAYADNPSPDELARRYTAAERALLGSGYSTMRKFYGSVRALEADFNARQNADGTVGRPCPGNMAPANAWPVGTDVKSSFRHAQDLLLTLLQGTDLPPSLWEDGVDAFLEFASADPDGVALVLEPLAKLFESGELKEPSYRTKLIEGQFWVKYAWQARGGDWANTVTEQGWQLFGERLKKARAALEVAWKLDPTQQEAPREMLNVVLGQGSDDEELDRWFRRANDALPDQYETGRYKLLCLEPKWGGSAEEMIAFGRQCLATHDWASRITMILYQAHYRLAKDYSDNFVTYWRQPEVWADIHALFEPFLAANPTEYSDRTAYAFCAYNAGEWKVAHEQFEILGDHPSDETLQHEHVDFNSYQRLRRESRERAGANP